MFLTWASEAMCSFLDFPVQKKPGNTGRRAAVALHHQAREESGEQNIQGQAKIDVLAQPGEKEDQEIIMNSSCILGKIFFIKMVKYQIPWRHSSSTGHSP